MIEKGLIIATQRKKLHEAGLAEYSRCESSAGIWQDQDGVTHFIHYERNQYWRKVSTSTDAIDASTARKTATM